MDQVQDDGARLGLLGPWRRWRSWALRERVGLASTWVVSGATAGLFWYLVSPLLGDDTSLGSAVFFGVGMTAVSVYAPELTRLWRKTDDDS